MTTQPIAIYRDERLWLCDGGAYSPTNRFKVFMMAEEFKAKARSSAKDFKEFGIVGSPLAAEYASQLEAALTEYDKAMEEAK